MLDGTREGKDQKQIITSYRLKQPIKKLNVLNSAEKEEDGSKILNPNLCFKH